jgi:hypothetical protein
MAAYIKSGDHLTVVFDNGETITVYESHTKYKEIVGALKAKDYDLVKRLASPAAAVKQKIAAVARRGYNTVELIDGVVYFNNQPLHNTLTDRIISMASEGFDIEPMCKFLANLQDNPSYRAVNELYSFLEKGNLPITEDGHFLAYKKVRDDYKDVHSGKFDNSVGQVVTMPRNQVNEDPNQTCSAGLHFCSRSYLDHFGGARVMILKINPADVVAIPRDYNDSKGRTCRYEVIGELGADEKLEGDFRPSADYVPPSDPPPVADLLPPQEVVPHVVAVDPNDGSVVNSYVSIQAAAAAYGVTASMIRRVLNGERKTTGGVAWRYSDSKPVAENDLQKNGTLNHGRCHDDDWDDDSWDDDDYW